MTFRITLKRGAQLPSRISHVRVSMLWQSPRKLADAKASHQPSAPQPPVH